MVQASTRYNPAEIEAKWQRYWLGNKTFKAVDCDASRPKLYVLDMFPYPSGSGLHVGHPEGYTATDIWCRYKRMCGYNVLHPMGWDAFGLPAEQYAIQTGTHPAVTTRKNCDTFRGQIQRLGMSYDWDREINTTDKKYYRWTQWIFTQLYQTWFDADAGKGRPIADLPIPPEVARDGGEAVAAYRDERRLAYYAGAQVWWCNHCHIVCANEEILADGSHEKCGGKEVERRFLKQWLLRIPHYAERLLQGLDDLDWPEGIKEMQRNWIGKSTGAEVDFEIAGGGGRLRVYTTRPDTLFGATYMVLAPEHPLVADVTTEDRRDAVAEYVRKAALKSDLDRAELTREKTGVFTGAYAVNPVNGQRIPIWLADYVLMGYGTGAIMAVPAHDTRDFDFAKTFDLPVVCIMEPDTSDTALKAAVLAGDACWTEDGVYIRSASDATGLDIDGLSKSAGIATVTAWLEREGLGKPAVNYKLRDWLFSRQRYWGEPFPVAHMEDGSIRLLDDDELPVTLPELENFAPSGTGESPLANAQEWLDYRDPVSGMKGRRETNTMPQWAGSCWYYLRYIDPDNERAAWDAEKERYWMPVDLYVGGAEHAVLHLLYSRFWHKVLYDLGLVSSDEPFKRLFNQGMILAFAYEDARGSKVPSDQVEEKDGAFFHRQTGEELKQIVAKMSKTLKNVVNPDEIVDRYGADSLRLYEMFMGPLDAMKPWQTTGVEGVSRFLHKVWRLVVGPDGELAAELADGVMSQDQERLLHATIKKVAEDTESLDFNTAISQMMVFVNAFSRAERRDRAAVEIFVKLLSPYAPHVAEELWQRLGYGETLAYEPWPTCDESKLTADEVEILVQVLGKPKARVMMPPDADPEIMRQLALAETPVKQAVEGKTIVKVVAVPGRLVNIVAK